MVPKRNIVACSALLFLLSPPAFSKLFDLGRGNNGNVSPSVPSVVPETPAPSIAKETPAPLIANEDFATIIANKEPEVTGNVLDNDSNGDFATLTSSIIGQYGYIIFNNDGSFSYTLDSNSPEVIALKARELVTDQFTYSYSDKLGNSVSSALNVRVIGNPVDGSGNTIFKQPENTPFDNVDIEFNDRSAQATPLNSALNIKGHLYKSSDKDWYKIPSNGNESLIFEVCPQGSSCFGQKSWVLYIFDSSLLTTAMEERVYQFSRWLDETGTTEDLSGSTIINSGAGTSNHMYLAYKAGFFDGALIGVVDPCFGSLNSVEVGLPVNPKNADGTPVLDNTGNPLKPQDYLIAISSPLKGDGEGDCGVGDVVLNKAGRSALGAEAPTIKDNGDGTFSTIPGKAKTYTTTEEYIVVAPNSDDQYTIKVTSTGRNPLLSAEAQKASSALSTAGRTLKIPKIRIGEQLFSANLELRPSVAGQPLLFSVADIAALGADAIADAFQATYNPSNQQVVFPRVTVSDTGDAYSVILQYHVATANTAAWLEVVQATLIQ